MIDPGFSLKDIWASGRFAQRSVNGVRPMKDGQRYSSLVSVRQGQFIVTYSYATGAALDTLAKLRELGKAKGDTIYSIPSIDDYAFTPDEKSILIATNQQGIFRYSTKEEVYIYNIATKLTDHLTAGLVSHATLSPVESKVCYVQANNLFVKDLTTGAITQITKDGKDDAVINGMADWVYEEEFGFTKGFDWAPDGKSIAFYRFDESRVPKFTMQIIDGDSLYPQDETFKYPKAGEENATVSLFIYRLKEKKLIPIAVKPDAERYIPRLKFTSSGDFVSFQQMNRHQNELTLSVANTTTGVVRDIFKETVKEYIEVTNDLTFLPDGKTFIWSNDASGFNHLYRYDLASGKQLNAITKGDWEVTSYEGYDPKTQRLFYLSTELGPQQRTLYSVKLDGSGKQKLSAGLGNDRAEFSGDFSHFLLYHSEATVPTRVSVHTGNGAELRVAEDNARLKAELASLTLSPKEFFDFTTEQGVKLFGYMIKPFGFDPTKKYPVLMYVYGGPGRQTVMNQYGGADYLWQQYMAAQGYLVVSVDNRGTDGRGAAFRKSHYLQLGKLELEDQIASAKFIGGYSFVDKDRIGIFGWSYGGFMASLCISKGADYFKSAVAVAPVANWKFYDSIYTERYMRTPAENPTGYAENSPSEFMDRVKGNYLLVHGTGDDNVHFQNALVLNQKLVEANIPFDFMAYVNNDHGIYGGYTRLHLFTKITKFLLTNL